ncbi:MAG: hypothetical protein HYU88_00295 [Chloroflexi bacterium]|nr:hypothetical protein [Chloroflexota bacterium]MBI4506572.1 hypothetical protein [Chloroflexota bacterium]
MWLQTDEGEEWLIDREDEGSDIPACADDVAAHITQMVYDIAADWSNDRIRKYLERGLDDW